MHLADGRTIAYDHLVMATGSPFVAPIPGRDQPGCFVYRTIEDLETIRDWSLRPGVSTGVVVGGGLLGLEAGNALRNLGLKTHAGSSSQSTVVTRLDRVAVDGFPYVLAPSGLVAEPIPSQGPDNNEIAELTAVGRGTA